MPAWIALAIAIAVVFTIAIVYCKPAGSSGRKSLLGEALGSIVLATITVYGIATGNWICAAAPVLIVGAVVGNLIRISRL